MLAQRSRTVLRSVSGLPSPFKPVQAGVYLAPLNPPVHVRQWSAKAIHLQSPLQRPLSAELRSLNRWTFISTRSFSSTRIARKEDPPAPKSNTPGQSPKPAEIPDETAYEFKRTEKGEAAKAVDLSARLKDRSQEKGEVTRLLKLAAREWRTLGGTSTTVIVLTTNSCDYITLYFVWCSNVNSLLNR